MRDGDGDGRQQYRHGWIPLSPNYTPAKRNRPGQWSDGDLEKVRAANSNEWGESFYGDQSSSDPKLAQVWAMQGFDGTPETLSPNDFDALGDDHKRLYRGLHGDQAETWAEEYRSGPAFAGLGVHGNGTYTSTDRNTAEEYSDLHGDGGGTVMDMALRPEARVGTSGEIMDDWDAKANADGTPRETEYAFGGDIGVIASALGYDAIRVTSERLHSDGEEYYVVLNRTAVVVKDPNKDDATPQTPSSSSNYDDYDDYRDNR